MIPFFPVFGNYSSVCTYTWRPESGNLWWDICSSGTGSLHSKWSFLVSSIYQQSSWSHFFPLQLNISHSVYVPHFHYPLVNWTVFRLLSFPSYCEYSSNEHDRATTRVVCQVLSGICQGVVLRGHMVDLFLVSWEFSTLISIYNGVRWNLESILISISLITRDAKYFLRHFLFCFSSFENSLSKS